MSFEEEFSVFDAADMHDFSDEREWLYGVLREAGSVRYLGTDDQQVAIFHPGEIWLGYPSWPLADLKEGKAGEKARPPKDVFDRMVQANLLTSAERKRLLKGKHV